MIKQISNFGKSVPSTRSIYQKVLFDTNVVRHRNQNQLKDKICQMAFYHCFVYTFALSLEYKIR